MATINISDLRPAGYELFSDSEGYMNEVGDGELDIINGGSTPISATLIISALVTSHVWLTYEAFK
ncbi:MAG: hypothetical protein RMZ42_03505 [Nostoc sp. DedQUE05]|uniref:hypothetical protein n=1 Tax=Nostoc sp. DedQUE05 TaxID=3075391 RepID=UPI002AD3C821|nr:hypothetical protein [Nostoc sp. DedQUE05]MDZ8090997.1 hypothetical protein [Nostoc sp. DedQUE05]